MTIGFEEWHGHRTVGGWPPCHTTGQFVSGTVNPARRSLSLVPMPAGVGGTVAFADGGLEQAVLMCRRRAVTLGPEESRPSDRERSAPWRVTGRISVLAMCSWSGWAFVDR